MDALTSEDRAVEAVLRERLARVRVGGSVCPSEAARAVSAEDWRRLMEPARNAARRLVTAGEAEVTQGGRVVDIGTAKGPIRVRPTAAP